MIKKNKVIQFESMSKDRSTNDQYLIKKSSINDQYNVAVEKKFANRD